MKQRQRCILLKRIFLSIILIVSFAMTVYAEEFKSNVLIPAQEQSFKENAVLPKKQVIQIQEEGNVSLLSKLNNEMSIISEKTKHMVVNISTTRIVKSPFSPFFNDPFFKRFFGEERFNQKGKTSNLGSGVIVSSDGYIVTCNHIVEGAEDIIVKLENKKEYKGKVIGTDPKTDIAIIKIDETNLPVMKWGDSDNLKVGEIVLAIGNPYGFLQTITMGIISGTSRSGMGISDYEDYIQTDAAINPGNSGGAMINIKGELIGINNAIYTTSGGSQGIGFAIPSNMVKSIMDNIISKGKVVRGWLGITIQPVTPELAKQFNMQEPKGVLISDIAENSPADKGGIKRGDIIIEYDDKTVNSPWAFKNMVASTIPGKNVKIKLMRNNILLNARIVIGELPMDLKIVSSSTVDNGLKGISVQELSDEYLKKMEITKKIKGVVVSSIEDNSPATGILEKDDIILEINKKPISSIDEFNKVVSSITKESDILLFIVRGGQYYYLTISSK